MGASLLYLLISCWPAAASTVVFDIPGGPGRAAGILDPSPVSFSYPFATIEGYFPNMPIAKKCMATFEALTGTWPPIRIGGTSEDYGTYDPDLDVANIVTGTASTGQAITTYGPLLMRLVADYKGTVIWGVNRGAKNLTNSIEAAKAAKRLIPTLYALELGNEPVIYAAIGLPIASNTSDWTPKVEAESEEEWQAAVGQALDLTHLVQAGSYYQPPSYGWSANNFFANANDTALEYIRVFSHHNYPQTTFATSGQGEPPNLEALMSHINITANVGPYAEDAKVANINGLQYVFGETNAVSGNGSPEQSPAFGTGLWALDYALQAASKNISRFYFHQGTPGNSQYVWFNETGIRSPFYGGYVAANAMAQGSHILALDNGTTNYAGYSIYSSTGGAQKAVLINTDFYDGTGARTSQQYTLSGLCGETVTARRLTATNSFSRQDLGDAPKFAGRSVGDSTCQLAGEETVEVVSVTNGSAQFTLAASEALLITL